MIFCLYFILQYKVSTTMMDLVVVFALFVFMLALLCFLCYYRFLRRIKICINRKPDAETQTRCSQHDHTEVAETIGGVNRRKPRQAARLKPLQ